MLMRRDFRFAAFVLVMLTAMTRAADSPPAPIAGVSQSEGKWTIAGAKQSITLDPKTFAIDVKAGPAAWAMQPSAAGDLRVKIGAGDEVALRLADAGKIDIVPYNPGFKQGVKITLTGWRHADAAVDLSLFITVCLEGKDEDLAIDVAAQEGATVVRQLDFPGPIDGRDVDHTLLPNLRGVLLPRDWPKRYHPIRSANPDGSLKESDVSEIQSHVIECWSMSWWGQQRGKSAVMTIVETPDDAAYQFDHPAGGPTVIGPRWRAQLGRFGYPRSLRMCFFANGNYVDMAKRYRRHVIDAGQFVSLSEKVARQPTVKELIGTPMTRAGILTNIKPDSDKYKSAKDPADNYHLTTFDARAEMLQKLKSQGVDRLTVVATGWPKLGYDRQHPDVLPPAPQAGGYDGMKRLAETCRSLGYTFSLHDQYRDYYVDAPSFDTQFAVHEEDEKSPPRQFPGTRFGHTKKGRVPYMDHWDGGRMAYLNSRFMLGHLEQNYQGLFDHGIFPQGSYLDVFGYVPPDQDFNPEHATTRTEAMRDRAACFNWCRTHLGYVGTEAGCDWTVPYVDVISPARPKNGVAVPLYNLVYHDAVLAPYAADDLHGLLNGGVPQIGGRSEITPETLAAARRMAKLNQRVALVEMTNHVFLDDARKKERTTFADGTTVTVDWDAKTAEIIPDLDAPPLPGKGLAQHPFMYCGQWDTRKPVQTMVIVRDGKVVWSYAISEKDNYFVDSTMLSNGNILFARKHGATEITPNKRIVWNYDAPAGSEVHSAQPVGKDKVLLMQNGDPAKLLLINKTAGTTEKEIVLKTAKPENVHGQFRHIRMTKAGTFLVPHMDLGKVVEYDADGKEIWSVDAKSCWAAVRLKNGNTLISGNQNGYVREVNPRGEVVWELNKNDLPGIPLYTVQEVSRLANGNTLICNWVGGVKRPDWPTVVQVIEVTPEKKAVWALREWNNPDLGPASSVQLLDEPGIAEDGELQR